METAGKAQTEAQTDFDRAVPARITALHSTYRSKCPWKHTYVCFAKWRVIYSNEKDIDSYGNTVAPDRIDSLRMFSSSA